MILKYQMSKDWGWKVNGRYISEIYLGTWVMAMCHLVRHAFKNEE